MRVESMGIRYHGPHLLEEALGRGHVEQIAFHGHPRNRPHDDAEFFGFGEAVARVNHRGHESPDETGRAMTQD